MDAIQGINKQTTTSCIEKNSLKLRITDWRNWHYGKDLVC